MSLFLSLWISFTVSKVRSHFKAEIVWNCTVGRPNYFFKSWDFRCPRHSIGIPYFSTGVPQKLCLYLTAPSNVEFYSSVGTAQHQGW